MLGKVLAVAVLACGAAWLWGRAFESRPPLFTPEQLGRFSGEGGGPGPYLALLGQVFDVRRGSKHYEPGGAYSFFAGRDASRAFATGDFSPAGLVDDLSGLSPGEMLAIQDWLSFYRKNYVPVGKVSGRFYDADGAPTEELRRAEALMAEGRRLQAQEEERKQRLPPCNSEWSAAGGGGGGGGGRVWCSKQSGGVRRDWAGVPRRLHEPGSGGRCVCVEPGRHQGDLGRRLQEYPGCPPLAEWCPVGA